jgi:hypothetical protein
MKDEEGQKIAMKMNLAKKGDDEDTKLSKALKRLEI